jgi:hypothetical protein
MDSVVQFIGETFPTMLTAILSLELLFSAIAREPTTIHLSTIHPLRRLRT